MTNHRIRTRNRKNAQKSTGPKTPQGKAAIVQNARLHGLTGRPDPERLRAWLAVILDQPQITPSDLMGDADYHFLALKLAEAEERLVAAQEAMAAFEREPEVVPTTWREMMGEFLDVLAFAKEVDGFAPPDFGALRLRMRVLNEKIGPRSTGPSLHENRRRLLLRYLNEARARRNRAFSEWISLAADEKQYQMDKAKNERGKRLLARYRYASALNRQQEPVPSARFPKQSGIAGGDGTDDRQADPTMWTHQDIALARFSPPDLLRATCECPPE